MAEQLVNPRQNTSLILRWQEPDNPLPRRVLRRSRKSLYDLPGQGPAPWLDTGAEDRPFDFCSHVRRLLNDIAARCEAFAHVRVPHILIGVTQARNGHAHGLQARVTPLRFQGGRLLRRRRGIDYQVQRYFLGDHEFLYLMTFCLPRFLDQDFDSKFITLLHELYHIGPQFDGDLRRHEGRYALHSHSQRGYDRHMADLARAYLADRPDPDLHAFLRLDAGQLQARHGAIEGVVVPRPRIIPVA
jgi:hypothetical protein